MERIMATKEKVIIGLDIGSTSLKYANLVQIKGGFELAGFGVRDLNELKDLAKELPNKNVNISICGPAVIVRYIQLPKMKEEELASSLEFEAEKYIPFNISDVILDHQILEKDAAEKMKVLLVAAKKDLVQGRIKLLEDAGLVPNIIDVDSFAVINAFTLNNPTPDPDKVMALLNMGERINSVNIISNNIPYFTRTFTTGAADALEEARIADMSNEIRASFSYLENQIGRGIDQIYISGMSSGMEGIIRILNETLGVETKNWDPTAILAVRDTVPKEDLNNIKNELAIAIGLALRE